MLKMKNDQTPSTLVSDKIETWAALDFPHPVPDSIKDEILKSGMSESEFKLQISKEMEEDLQNPSNLD